MLAHPHQYLRPEVRVRVLTDQQAHVLQHYAHIPLEWLAIRIFRGINCSSTA